MNRDATILQHRPLAEAVAYSMIGRQESLDDAIQAGMIGLIRAVDGYNPELGSLERRVAYCVRAEILDWLRKDSPRSRNGQEFLRQVDKAVADLTGETGRRPSSSQIAVRLRLSDPRYRQLCERHAFTRLVSLDAGGSPDNDEATLLGTLTAAGPSPLEQAGTSQAAGQLWAAVDELAPRSAKAVRLYFAGNLTCGQIGLELGLSSGRAFQIIQKALRKLRADDSVLRLGPENEFLKSGD